MAATHTTQDDDMFRRRVQQKLAEKYSEGLDGDTTQPDGSFGESGQPAKKQSPYCIQNFLWLGVAVAVFYFSDFIGVVGFDQRIKSTWFWIGVLFMTIHIGIAGFLVFWLNLYKKIGPDEWEGRHPKAIPVATASFVVGLICLSIGLWPVYGLLTPVILLTLFVGIVVIVAMVG